MTTQKRVLSETETMLRNAERAMKNVTLAGLPAHALGDGDPPLPWHVMAPAKAWSDQQRREAEWQALVH